jgi:hypothetical protein
VWEGLLVNLKNVALAVSAGLALAAAGSAAHATPLAPGGSAPASSLPVTGTTVASTSGTFVSDLGNGDFSGSFVEYVLKGDVYGKNDLAWYIEITNNKKKGAADIDTISVSFFKGFLTDVGYCATSGAHECGGEGTVLPKSESRTSNGAAIDFYVDINPTGATTDWLMIETNAISYTKGYISVENSGVATVTAYAPLAVAPVPEPSSWALMLLGFAGLGYARFEARKKGRSFV